MSAATRLEQVRELLRRTGADAVLIGQQKNVSWLTGGRSHVNIAAEAACCSLLVTFADCVLLANNIEARRLAEEELGQDAAAVLTAMQAWDWWEPEQKERLLRRCLPERAVLTTDAALEHEFLLLRSVVPEERRSELRELGRLAAEAVERTAAELRQGDSEWAIAGRLAWRCYERELEPVVNLVAVDERAFVRRHPLPTGKRLASYAMLVVCARRRGLIASATRLVHFGPVPDALRERHRAAARIDARIIGATRPGATLGELFSALQRFYADEGFAGEYRLHHQGGLTGFATREKLALPGETLAVASGQLYAWNPSVAGAKSEDTALVSADGCEVLTATGEYPTIEADAEGTVFRRPDILRR